MYTLSVCTQKQIKWKNIYKTKKMKLLEESHNMKNTLNLIYTQSPNQATVTSKYYSALVNASTLSKNTLHH